MVKNIKETQDKGFQVRLICTVSKVNLEKSLNLIDFCSKQLEADMLSYHYFSPIGLAKDRVDELILPKEWIDFCDKIEKYPIPDNFWVYYPPTFTSPDKLSRFVERGYKGCTARWFERLAILPSGQIYACSVFFDTDKNFALWENGQLKIRDSKNTEMKSIYKLDENCLDCPHHDSCSGGCSALRDLNKNFSGVINSRNCDKRIVPMCPLWTTHAGESNRPPTSIQELR